MKVWVTVLTGKPYWFKKVGVTSGGGKKALTL